MKALGLIFRNFFEFLIFVNFCMFYHHMNIAQIRIFEKSEKYLIWSIFEKTVEQNALICFKKKILTMCNLLYLIYAPNSINELLRIGRALIIY